MLPATVLYNDRFGGGYYTLIIVWWWAPTLPAVIFVSAIPSALRQKTWSPQCVRNCRTPGEYGKVSLAFMN